MKKLILIGIGIWIFGIVAGFFEGRHFQMVEDEEILSTCTVALDVANRSIEQARQQKRQLEWEISH